MRESLMPLMNVFAPIPTVSAATDTRLERFTRGDLVAFESIFQEFQAEIYRCVARIVRNRETAEELTVETFWRVYNARARFDPKGNFRAWARRIAINLAIDSLKRKVPETTLAIEPSVAAPDPAVDRERREKIARAFRELPAKLQVAAELALIEQQNYADIAADLGISINGVKSRVFRAVRILRKKLKRMGIEP